MFRVTREIDFCYGHRLLRYDGKCKHLHGHNGRAVISIEKERYNPSLDLAFTLADLFERRIEEIFTPNRTSEEGTA